MTRSISRLALVYQTIKMKYNDLILLLVVCLISCFKESINEKQNNIEGEELKILRLLQL